MKSPKAGPIFFWEPNDLLVFDSEKEACAYLEPEDVAAGTCIGFDTEGRGLLAVVERGGKQTFLGSNVGTVVRLVPHGESDVDQERMREIFLRFLQASGQSVDLDASFDVLRRRAADLGRTR